MENRSPIRRSGAISFNIATGRLPVGDAGKSLMFNKNPFVAQPQGSNPFRASKYIGGFDYGLTPTGKGSVNGLRSNNLEQNLWSDQMIWEEKELWPEDDYPVQFIANSSSFDNKDVSKTFKMGNTRYIANDGRLIRTCRKRNNKKDKWSTWVFEQISINQLKNRSTAPKPKLTLKK